MSTIDISRPVPSDSAVEAEYLIVLAGSAGALDGIRTILAGLPVDDFPAAVAVVLHRTSNPPMLLDRVLQRTTSLPVRGVEEGEILSAGRVYVVPPDRHMALGREHRVMLWTGAKIRGARSSANPLIESAAAIYGRKLIVVVLSGGDGDATDGVQGAREKGGTVIAQEPGSARVPAMPESAIATGAVNAVLPVERIAPLILDIIARERAGTMEHG